LYLYKLATVYKLTLYLMAAEIHASAMKKKPKKPHQRHTLNPQIIPSISSEKESMTAAETTGAAKKPAKLKSS